MEDSLKDNPAILVKDVVRTFASTRGVIRALDGVSFTVPAGTITGLIGPDGAGKTTMMRILAGIMGRDRGQITVLGDDPAVDSSRIQGVMGYMPQKFGLYEDLTVQENLDLQADLHGVDPDSRAELYAPLFSMTALAPFRRRLAGKLSGGMKQKLGVACSLVHAPPLLLLDEPTVGVDPVSRRELWEILTRQVREKHTTLLVSTSYMDEAERFDRVVILYAGRVLGEGDPDAFLKEMSGHVFRITVEGTSTRQLEPVFARLSGVQDAVGEEDGVRVVVRDTKMVELPSGLENPRTVAVPPRFEDAFMSRLANSSEQAGVRGHPPESLSWGNSGKKATDPNGPSIVIRNLTRYFGSFCAVDNLNFEVGRGEIFGLLGANGAGKTTTFRMLSGLLLPSSGDLLIDGQDVRKSQVAVRRRLGYMAQKFSLYSQLTVSQNLVFFSSAYGLSGKRQKDRIDEIMEFFDLTPYSDESAGLLPLGFRQRLALAATLMHEPSILLLDEPTSGVDPLARREFWRIISHLSLQGVSVMVTTHFMSEAEYCDRLAIMAQGRLLSLGTPAEIRARARSEKMPHPSLEEAFIFLLDASGRPENAA